ncbi:MAG: bifunctional DNA-formamidopyrimidine glycosylase/DNA-(apurinic or apyrimidinic site) lyase [Oligoflexales bacterium]|nr:bifunctional DNA-formamidopyrimidine glycosylase/DNA-(apurinic or apyrimidinic site) lyase [Oligoflexales bacterium]
MPELPEVETVVKSLAATCQGLTATEIKFYRKDIREPIPIPQFRKALLKQAVVSVERRSKYIIMNTKTGSAIFHLGMSGQLLALKSKKPQFKHTHLVMTFTGEAQNIYLHFVDPRRFGRISAHLGEAWEQHPFFGQLGCEPLEQRSLGTYLWNYGKKSNRPIKSLLMDSKVVVGIGNIYACESLFLAGVHPERSAASLSPKDYQAIAAAAKKTLRLAIKAGGTSIKDFKSMEGKSGYFAISLNVYGRSDESCNICGNSIGHIKQSGRSTWFCGLCQK